MIFPSKKEYIKKALNHNLIPVYKEFIADTETPASIFIKAGGMEKEGFLLESIEGAKSMARFSFIGIGYNSRIHFSDGTFLLDSNNNKSLELSTAFPLNEIKKIMEQHRPCKIPELDHFIGGAVGYLSYDLVKYFDDIQLPGASTGIPEIVLFLTDLVIVFDHMLNRMKIISTIKIDENITAEKAKSIAGEDVFDFISKKSIEIYERCADYALSKGLIIADTKFEFGEIDGEIILIDEVLTPDSSRFWPKDTYSPGKSQPSFDKQFVRDYLETLDWNKTPPGPVLPDEIVNKTRQKYYQALNMLTGGRG